MLATPGRGEAGDSLDAGGKVSPAKLPDVTVLYLRPNSSHSFYMFCWDWPYSVYKMGLITS